MTDFERLFQINFEVSGWGMRIIYPKGITFRAQQLSIVIIHNIQTKFKIKKHAKDFLSKSI